MKYLHLFLFILLAPGCMAQYGKDFTLMNNRVIVNHTESTVYAFVLPDKSGRKTDDDYFYYWFASNDIKHTRGAYEGKLLHGQYTEFYLNKNLKEKGKVKYGLKKGIWKSWYPNGEYKEIVRYRKSQRIGHTAYYENGAVMSEGRYKNNLLHGKVRNYATDGKVTKVKYRYGTLVNPPPAKDKKGFWRKKSKSMADSSTVKDTAALKKNKGWFRKKKQKQTVVSPADPYQQVLPSVPGDQEKKKKSKKGKQPDKTNSDVKIRKFLWIIPVQPAPAKEKQT